MYRYKFELEELTMFLPNKNKDINIQRLKTRTQV